MGKRQTSTATGRRVAAMFMSFVVFAALVLVAVPAASAQTVAISSTIVFETVSQGPGSNRCNYEYFIQFPDTPGVVTYSAFVHDSGYIGDRTFLGPPFQDAADGYAPAAPAGMHRFSLTGGAGPDPCTDTVRDRWTKLQVTGTLGQQQAVVQGTVLDTAGKPVAGVVIDASDTSGTVQSSGKTTAAGTYQTGALSSGTYVVAPHTDPAKYTPSSKQIVLGSSPVTVNFTYYGGPVVTAVDPATGPANGGTKITISGSGFGTLGGTATVMLAPTNGATPVAATHVTVITDTTITATTGNARSDLASGAASLPAHVEVTTTGTSAPTPADIFTYKPVSIVELGDSVASGEGTLYGYYYSAKLRRWQGGNVDAKWPGPYPLCHDSPAAYGQVVATAINASFNQFACTGASYLDGITVPETITNLVGQTITYRPAEFGNWATQSNLNPAYDVAEPDVVLATFGADDIQFVQIVTDCLTSALTHQLFGQPLRCTGANPGPVVQKDFYAELPSLRRDYAALVAGIEARGNAAITPKVPKIVFTNYFDPFAPNGRTCPDTLNLYPDQLRFVDLLLTQLNQTIRQATTGLGDPNVSFVDESSVFVGHTWCTSDPWDYGLSVLTNTPGGLRSQAPFHPTPAGQAAMAALVKPVLDKALNGS